MASVLQRSRERSALECSAWESGWRACRMEKMYTAVLTAQKAAIAALQPGKPLSAAHGAVIVSLTSSGAPLACSDWHVASIVLSGH